MTKTSTAHGRAAFAWCNAHAVAKASVFAFVVTAIAALRIGVATAATFYVDASNPSCSDAGPGSDTSPYCSITAALTARRSTGTTILVNPSVYREQLTVAASGTATSPYEIRANGPGVVIDGAEDFSTPIQWTLVSGDVWLAAGVNWSAKQVILDGQRLASSALLPANLLPGTYRYVSGTGLYVNAGGGNPGAHSVFVSRRSHGFRVSGRSHVLIEGFTIARTQDRAIYLSGFSNYVTIRNNTIEHAALSAIYASNAYGLVIDNNRVLDTSDHGIFLTGVSSSTVEDNLATRCVLPGDKPASGIFLTSGSQGNIVQRNRLCHNRGSGLKIASQSYSNLSSQNLSWANAEHGFEHLSSADTRHIGDVSCGNGLSGFCFMSGSNGATIHNSIAAHNAMSGAGYELMLDATSEPGLTSDCNGYWNTDASRTIKCGKTAFSSVAAFFAFCGQDSCTFQSDPLFVDPGAGLFQLLPGSPAIDAANSSVPGFPGVDIDGRAPFDVATVLDMGQGPVPFADRGATEFVRPGVPPMAKLTATPASGNAPLDVTTDATGSTDANGSIVSYRFEFSDGTVIGPLPQPTATYQLGAGTWQASVIVTDNDGFVDTATVQIVVTGANQAPEGRITNPDHGVMIAAGQSVRFFGDVTDPDGPAPLTHYWDFSGGAEPSTLEDPGAVVFANPGNYIVTYTAFDGLGLPDPTPSTMMVTVRAPVPGVTADGIHWTFSGPTSVTLSWRGADAMVRYGLTTAYGLTTTGVPPEPYPFSSGGPYWEARINGLAPNTEYHYSIAGGPDHVFRTPPARGASDFVFYAFGDIGSSLNYANVPLVQTQIAQGAPDFCLILGDLTYGNDKGQAAVDRHFNDMMAWSQDAAYMPTWGNHDWGAPDNLTNYKGRFELPNPQASPGTPILSCCGEDWYWFDYGNVRFIAYPEPWAGALAAWQTKATTLMQQADADTAIDFVVTFGHRPAYSSGHHSGETGLKGILDALGDAHAKYVLNLNGHSHNYERSHPQHGVIHVTSGTGGASLEPAAGVCKWAGGCPAPEWSAFRAMHYVTFRLEVMDGGIVGRAICGPAGTASNNDMVCAQGTVIDSFVIGTRADRAPVVSAPAAIQAPAHARLAIVVTAADPDGTPIDSLTADLSALPAGHGATFTTTADRDSATLAWTPRSSAIGGPYVVTFRAANALAGTATTSITVVRPDTSRVNLVRNPSFETSAAGWNANGTGAVLARVAGGHEGSFCAELRGAATGTASFGLNDSPNWVGSVSTAGSLYRFGAWVRSENHRGKAQIKIREYVAGIQQGATLYGAPVDLSPAWQWITVDVVASAAGATFDLQVIDKPLVPGEVFQVDDVVAYLVPPAIPTNDPPVAALAARPAFGFAPLSVIADAGGSQDPEGGALEYRFDFGDGATAGPQATPTASHSYAAGEWRLSVIVTDAQGDSDTTTVPVVVVQNLVRNPSFETALTGWNANGSGTPTIARVAGGRDGAWCVEARAGTGLGPFGINDAPNWVSPHGGVGARYRFSAWVRSAAHGGKAWIRVREFLNNVQQGATLASSLVTLSPSWQQVTIDAVASVAGGTLDFQVVETPAVAGEVFQVDEVSAFRLPPSIAVIAGNEIESVLHDTDLAIEPLHFGARLYPNPPARSATLELVTTRHGAARAQLFDTQGRVVRTLLDESVLAPGRHALRFETRGPGSRLAPGMYFYAIQASEGRLSGKFVILE